MKYFLAILACGAEILAYAVIGAFLGWKGGGGIIPMLILFSFIGWTWHSITRSRSQTSNATTDDSTDTPAGDAK